MEIEGMSSTSRFGSESMPVPSFIFSFLLAEHSPEWPWKSRTEATEILSAWILRGLQEAEFTLPLSMPTSNACSELLHRRETSFVPTPCTFGVCFCISRTSTALINAEPSRMFSAHSRQDSEDENFYSLTSIANESPNYLC